MLVCLNCVVSLLDSTHIPQRDRQKQKEGKLISFHVSLCLQGDTNTTFLPLHFLNSFVGPRKQSHSAGLHHSLESGSQCRGDKQSNRVHYTDKQQRQQQQLQQQEKDDEQSRSKSGRRETLESVHLHNLFSLQRVWWRNNKLQETHHLPAHCAAWPPGVSAAARVGVTRPASGFPHGRTRGHLRPWCHSVPPGPITALQGCNFTPCPQTLRRGSGSG